MIKNEFIKNQKRLILFSGGADSMALLHCMQTLNQVDLVIHFNHNLRAQASDQDEQFCRTYCRENQLKLKVVSLDLQSARQANEGDEQVARRLRLAYLEENYASWNIYLGHHQDDVKESFFMRAMRGANSSGLCALRKERALGELTLIRPLLDYTRDQLREYLNKNNLSWCEDATNHDAEYCDRNFLRNEIMPKLSKLGQGLNHTLQHIADDDDFLQESAKQQLSKGFSTAYFLACHNALKPRVLRLFFENYGVPYIASQASLKRLVKECSSLPESYKDIPMGEGFDLRIWKDGEISLPPQKSELIWDWQNQVSIVFAGYRFFIDSSNSAESFALDQMPPKILLRTPQQGDKIHPFGKSKKLLLSKIFSDAKLTHQERCTFPLICAGEEIIYLAGLRRAEFARVKANQRSVRIAYERV
jgi:tRNA(Ile)-lysidine synthase